MAAVLSAPPAPKQLQPQPTSVPGGSTTAPKAEDCELTWEQVGHRGDVLALLCWLLCVGAMALMTILDPLLGLLR